MQLKDSVLGLARLCEGLQKLASEHPESPSLATGQLVGSLSVRVEARAAFRRLPSRHRVQLVALMALSRQLRSQWVARSNTEQRKAPAMPLSSEAPQMLITVQLLAAKKTPLRFRSMAA